MDTNLFSRLNMFFRNHPVWRWITAIVIILFSAYTILVPLIARWQIEKWMKENGEVRVKVERITFNPFIMKLRVHGLFAEGSQKGKMEWKRMAFDMDVFPLYQQRIVISELALHEVLITVQKNREGNWVIGGIAVKPGSGSSKSGNGKKEWKFGVSKTVLTDIQIRYRGSNTGTSDTLKGVFVLQIKKGVISNFARGPNSMSVGTTRMEGVKTSTSSGSSDAENTRPSDIQAGVFAMYGLVVKTKLPEITIESVAIQALDASVVRDKDGNFRITKIFSKTNKGNTSEKPDSIPPLVSIKKFTIDRRSQIELMDLSMEPQVTIQATDLRFTLNNLYSSNEKAPGTYNLTANIQPKATLKAEGTIGPIFPKPDLTVKSEVNNFNVAQLSSYMVNLFGYEIDSGRLDGTTNGNVKTGQLDLVSQVKVNNLEIAAVPEQSAYYIYKNAFLGMSLESALSIITDKNGDVNLNIPVNGNLSDPKFNFTDVLRAAIVNSISGGLNSVYNDSLP